MRSMRSFNCLDAFWLKLTFFFNPCRAGPTGQARARFGFHFKKAIQKGAGLWGNWAGQKTDHEGQGTPTAHCDLKQTPHSLASFTFTNIKLWRILPVIKEPCAYFIFRLLALTHAWWLTAALYEKEKHTSCTAQLTVDTVITNSFTLQKQWLLSLSSLMPTVRSFTPSTNLQEPQH